MKNGEGNGAADSTGSIHSAGHATVSYKQGMSSSSGFVESVRKKRKREVWNNSETHDPNEARAPPVLDSRDIRVFDKVQAEKATNVLISTWSATDNGNDQPVRSLASVRGPPIFDRVVCCVDVDYFYCQCEILKRNLDGNKPIAVTQKHIVVTCNYPARERGVGKLQLIRDAKKACPDLMLLSGEDLTPYRAYCEQIRDILRTFGPIETASMDETFIDITDESQRLVDGRCAANVIGHSVSDGYDEVELLKAARLDPCHTTLLLQAGSQVAASARRAVRDGTGLTTCAGVGLCRMHAKLASSMHKPNSQTVLSPAVGARRLLLIPLRNVPGVGQASGKVLSGYGAVNLLDCIQLPNLLELVGENRAEYMLKEGVGKGNGIKTVVSGPSISVEDSFAAVSSWDQCDQYLHHLSKDLHSRLMVKWRMDGYAPKTLTIKVRFAGDKVSWATKSGPVNPSLCADTTRGFDTIYRAAKLLLKSVLQPSFAARKPFLLTLLGLTATGFKCAESPSKFRTLDELAFAKAENPAIESTCERHLHDSKKIVAGNATKTSSAVGVSKADRHKVASTESLLQGAVLFLLAAADQRRHFFAARGAAQGSGAPSAQQVPENSETAAKDVQLDDEQEY